MKENFKNKQIMLALLGAFAVMGAANAADVPVAAVPVQPMPASPNVVSQPAQIVVEEAPAQQVELPATNGVVNQLSTVKGDVELTKAQTDLIKAKAEYIKAVKEAKSIEKSANAKEEEKLSSSPVSRVPVFSQPAKPKMYVKSVYGMGSSMKADVELSTGEPMTITIGDSISSNEQVKEINAKGVVLVNTKTKKTKTYNVTLDRSSNANLAVGGVSAPSVGGGLLPPPVGLPMGNR